MVKEADPILCKFVLVRHELCEIDEANIFYIIPLKSYIKIWRYVYSETRIPTHRQLYNSLPTELKDLKDHILSGGVYMTENSEKDYYVYDYDEAILSKNDIATVREFVQEYLSNSFDVDDDLETDITVIKKHGLCYRDT